MGLFTLYAYAQKDVTKFLGIPVDGTKAEMIQKLKAKGFKLASSNNDALVGEFNGSDVILIVSTNGNKVCRIAVMDENSVGERDIQIRFNRLINQFDNNLKYIPVNNEKIPDDEDISYEIAAHNKRYEAVFYQAPDAESLDSLTIKEEFLPILMSKYSPEQLANPTEEIQQDLLNISMEYLLESCRNKSVWFMISERFGKYAITMFYDNEYNRANGEDL